MSEQEDGGPAFPRPCDPCSCDGSREFPCTVAYDGMSLRDYFASQAMVGIMASPYISVATAEIAKWSYYHADAMLEARKVESE